LFTLITNIIPFGTELCETWFDKVLFGIFIFEEFKAKGQNKNKI